MSKQLKAFCLACSFLALTPALADYSELQATATGSCGQTVTVTVHNPTSGPVSGRVRVDVKLDDDTYSLLTSASFTVTAGSTATLSLLAPAPVAEITDEPEPIGS
jgi:hypothetical protein